MRNPLPLNCKTFLSNNGLNNKDLRKETSRRSDAWVTREPKSEAHDLYRMVRYGSFAIARVRELIAVPPEIESALRAYAVAYPEDSGNIERVLGFRKKVAQEFERLIAPLALVGSLAFEGAAAAPGLLEAVAHNQQAA
jgi:hypothetical protein